MTESSGTRATLWIGFAAATLTVMAGAILGLVSPLAESVIDRVDQRRPFVTGGSVVTLGVALAGRRPP